PPLKTAADYRNSIIRELFNRMLGERYAELSRRANVPFVQSGAEISGFIGGLDSYDASVMAKPGELEAGFKAVWRETERVKRFGFTATELQRAKSAFLNSMDAAVQEKDKTNSQSYVKEYQAYFLKGVAAPGVTTEYSLVKKDLPTITLAEVNSLATAYIKNTNRDILVLAPEKDKAGLPNETTVNQWLASVAAESLKPYQDAVSSQPLLTTLPVAGRIVSEQRTSAATETMVLSNGVRVVLKPTTFKNDEILFNGFASGGTSLYSDADYQSAANAADLIAGSGAGNYNADQLDKYLEGKQLQVTPFINERFEGIKGGTTRKDLETTLQLIYAYFTEPRKDTAIFNGIIAKSKAALFNRASDPASIFKDTISAVLGNYNARRTGPSIAKLNQIELDKAYQIYKERFADASGFTFTFTGSIDTNTIKPLLEKYFGSLPAKSSNETANDLNIHVPDGRIEKMVYKGTEPKSTVLLVFSGKFDYSPENKVTLDALKECLEIRLLQRLREDESGVYSPGVFTVTSKLPQQRYSFVIQFGCAPKNVEKLIASTLDEISKLKTDGPPQENVDKWRAEEKTARGTALQTNNFWLNYISGQLQDGGSLNEVNSYGTQLNQVSPADVKAVAGQYLSGKNYIRLVLMPESGIASK
ncbi:MAG: insulinase family protein, partial [Bacteroidetes bacterium]|nr:insulinase family protein [Bacteroidota bacterium]